MPTSDIAKWDIVTVPFPYVEINAQKRRPALVCSSRNFTQKTDLLWVMMITTTKQDWTFDVHISDLESSGLPVPSKIRCAKMATIERSRVDRVIGRLTQNDVSSVEAAMKKIVE